MIDRSILVWVSGCFAAACIAGAIGCRNTQPETPAAGSSPDIEALARNYKQLSRITPKPVRVSQYLLWLCRVPTAEDLAAEKRKHGPHTFGAVHIYMNELATQAFRSGARSYPVGAVVVKDKNAGLDDAIARGVVKKPEPNYGVGGMVKRAPGFDPEHGDWEYFYFTDPAKIARGKLASCVKCHASPTARDHVFGTWARRGTRSK